MLKRFTIVAAGAAVLVAVLAMPASAHVTVNPNTATPGAYTKVSFRVPTESDTASTTKLEVDLPTGTPIASVALKPVQGWTAVATESRLAKPLTTGEGQVTQVVSKIVWTAASGSAIKPGQFQEFDVSLGPLPDNADQIIFKALQYYSDGSVVRWIDLPNADGSEPAHPAPILKLIGAQATAASVPIAAASSDKSGGSGTGWGIAALIVAVIALALGALAYRRSTRPAAA